mgnify:CR=1 FL=1
MSTMTITLDDFTVSTDPTGDPVTFKLTNLDGWYSSPPVRVNVIDMPLTDGGFNPVRAYRSPRQLAAQGFVYGGTAEQAIELAWQVIAAIGDTGNAITLTVTDDSDTKTMQVWLAGAPLVLPFGPNRARFNIPLVAADPRKYKAQDELVSAPAGSAADGLTFPLFAPGFLDFGTFSPSGRFSVTNYGTAESWPIFKVRGGLTVGFQIIADSNVVTYSAAVAAGTEYTLSPYAGGRVTQGTSDYTQYLTQSDWPSILPGQTRLFVFNPLGSADANAQLTTLFSDAWW